MSGQGVLTREESSLDARRWHGFSNRLCFLPLFVIVTLRKVSQSRQHGSWHETWNLPPKVAANKKGHGVVSQARLDGFILTSVGPVG